MVFTGGAAGLAAGIIDYCFLFLLQRGHKKLDMQAMMKLNEEFFTGRSPDSQGKYMFGFIYKQDWTRMLRWS